MRCTSSNHGYRNNVLFASLQNSQTAPTGTVIPLALTGDVLCVSPCRCARGVLDPYLGVPDAIASLLKVGTLTVSCHCKYTTVGT